MYASNPVRIHQAIVGLLLFGLGIEALTLYPLPIVFVLAVPLSMFGAVHCMDALINRRPS
jgi:hypothetical protein